MDPTLWFFSPRKWIYGVGVEVGGASGGPRGRGRAQGAGAPPPSWTGCGSPGLDSFSSIFYFFQKVPPRIFRTFRELSFSTHKTTSWQFCWKIVSVRVSFIQIMQVRVQNKGKSVWKSRYVGDVSLFISSRVLKISQKARLFIQDLLLLLASWLCYWYE